MIWYAHISFSFTFKFTERKLKKNTMSGITSSARFVLSFWTRLRLFITPALWDHYDAWFMIWYAHISFSFTFKFTERKLKKNTMSGITSSARFVLLFCTRLRLFITPALWDHYDAWFMICYG